MIFWIFAGIAAVAVILVIRFTIIERDAIHLLLAFAVSCAIAAVATVVIAISLAIWPGEWQETNVETESLAAIGASQSVQGQSYFLGSGYIDGKSALNFIANNDGTFQVRMASGDGSTIRETAKTPEDAKVTTRTYKLRNTWIWPWNISTGTTWEFEVPAGSIQTSFDIGVGK